MGKGNTTIIEVNGNWIKRFVAAAIVHGAIETGLAVFLVLGQASFYLAGAAILSIKVGKQGFNARQTHKRPMHFVEPILSAVLAVIIASIAARGRGFLVTCRSQDRTKTFADGAKEAITA